MVRAVAAFAAAALVADRASAVGVFHFQQEEYPDNLQPPLEDVKSDKKFYGKDLPHDEQPKLADDMQHGKAGPTYPALKDAKALDKDYVHDSNADRGEWAAQLAYDKARVRISKEEAAMKRAKEIATQEALEAQKAGQQVQDAQGKEEAARKAEAAAEEQAEAASKAAKESAEKTDKVEAENKENAEKASMSKEELSKKLSEANEQLEEQKVAFKACEQKLADAKALVERLKQQQQAAIAVKGSDSNDAVATSVVNHADAIKLSQSRAAAAEAKHEAVKARLAAVTAVKEKLEAQLAREKRQSADADEALKQETVQFDKATADMTDAQTRLRKARGMPEIKSAAVSPAALSPLAAAVVGMLVVAAAAA